MGKSTVLLEFLDGIRKNWGISEYAGAAIPQARSVLASLFEGGAPKGRRECRRIFRTLPQSRLSPCQPPQRGGQSIAGTVLPDGPYRIIYTPYRTRRGLSRKSAWNPGGFGRGEPPPPGMLPGASGPGRRRWGFRYRNAPRR